MFSLTALQQNKKLHNQLKMVLAIVFCLLFLSWGAWPWLSNLSLLRYRIPDHSLSTSSIHSINTDIAAQHFFGLYVQDYAHLPITTLPLNLQGTIINQDDAHDSTAIISISNAPAKLFSIHASLNGLAKIIAIHHQYCVLDHDGRLEKLTIPIPALINNPTNNELGPNSGLKVVS